MTNYHPFSVHHRRAIPRSRWRPGVHANVTKEASDQLELLVWWWIDCPLTPVQRALREMMEQRPD